jgi:hypothetical protein
MKKKIVTLVMTCLMISCFVVPVTVSAFGAHIQSNNCKNHFASAKCPYCKTTFVKVVRAKIFHHSVRVFKKGYANYFYNEYKCSYGHKFNGPVYNSK